MHTSFNLTIFGVILQAFFFNSDKLHLNTTLLKGAFQMCLF